MSMPEYQQRVVEEKKELDSKLEKLLKFFDTATFDELPVEEKDRMYRQSRYMKQYSEVLGERIEAFSA